MNTITTHRAHKIDTGIGFAVPECAWCTEPSAFLIVATQPIGRWTPDEFACGNHARRYYPTAFVSLAKQTPASHNGGVGQVTTGALRELEAYMPLVRSGLMRNNLRALDVALSILAN
jgi:hypothetical protein